MSGKLIVEEHRVLPCRGIIVTHNRRGRPFSTLDLTRWIRYCRVVHKAEKIDVLVKGTDLSIFGALFERANELDTRLSLRTDGTFSPSGLEALRDQGLHDVFLCPPQLDTALLDEWFSACGDLGLRVRLQLQAPFDKDPGVDTIVKAIEKSGCVSVVNLALFDAFEERTPCRGKAQSGETIAIAKRLAAELSAIPVEVNLSHWPFCIFSESDWRQVSNKPQHALDHQHYIASSHGMAAALYKRAPLEVSRALLIVLARDTLYMYPWDEIILPWLFHHTYLHVLAVVRKRVFRRFGVTSTTPLKSSKKQYERELARSLKKERKRVGSVCIECSLRRICDGNHTEFARVLPGVDVRHVEGDIVLSPMHFCGSQPKYYDDIDESRRLLDEKYIALGEEALRLTTTRNPDRIIGQIDYGVEGAHFDRMEGLIYWFTVMNGEKRSTPLARLQAPFTLSVDFGAGIAEYVGFSMGRHCKLVCPMEAYRHNLMLHVNRDGHYVLLRDGQVVRPAEFKGKVYQPLRIAQVVEPRISAWNIDSRISTSNIRIWEGHTEEEELPKKIKYSIMIVSTRFTRRLQAVLQCIAHQQDFDLSTVEVIVCYVPGIDATDDLIDSMSMTYPNLRILRAPFPEGRKNAKGFLINESYRLVSGTWLILLDSDILMPPTMLSAIDAVSDEYEFIAPDGRKMLSPETTSKILMGEIRPWENWKELLKTAGAFRSREAKSVPVGFYQCFKAKYLRENPYRELEHFEGSDMFFGYELKKKLGPEHRLSGLPVLHLDHGGSQWFGTLKHM